MVNSTHIIGMVITLLIIAGFGFYAGTRINDEKDYAGSSRKAGTTVVVGTILGTLVSGNSTIGAAQLAFLYGMDGWWFSLGGGIACLVLAIFVLKPIYSSKITTLPEYLVKTYGYKIGPISSICSSFSIFFNVVANGLAAIALITTVTHVSPTFAVILTLVVSLVYVMAGGIQGTGIVGAVKMALLLLAMTVAGGISLYKFGGISAMYHAFPNPFPWFSLFGRGVSKDLAAGSSLVLGVLSTQIYIQVISSAKTIGKARTGLLLSAFLSPVVGLGGVLVGLYMRAQVASFPGLESASANVLPTFILHYMPPLFGGIILATLFIATIGGIAGMNLGISTNLTRDIYVPYIAKGADYKRDLWVQRMLVLGLCVICVVCVNSSLGSVILSFGFLGQGLRACCAFFPLLGAMFFRRLVTPAAGIAAVILGPITNFLWHTFDPQGMDSLYPGLMASMVALIGISVATRMLAHKSEA